MFAARNQFLAPSGAATPPAYLSTGSSSTSTANPATYSDTVPAGSNVCGLIWVTALTSSATPTASASLGGTSATQAASIKVGTATYNQFLYCFYVLNPTPGTQTVSFTISSGVFFPAVCTDYYSGVTSVGSATTIGSQAGSPSMSASSVSGNLYANAFAYSGAATGNTFSAYNQTQRQLLAQTAAPSEPLIVGDAAGTGATLTFSASRTTSTYTWGGVVVPLI